MSLSPSSKKRRVLGPEEDRGDAMEALKSGRLRALATVASWVAEEKAAAERKRKGKASAYFDRGSSSSTSNTADREERRRRMGTTLAFFDLGSSGSTRNTARDAQGEARQQMKGKGKAVALLDVGASCSTSSAGRGAEREERKQRKGMGGAVSFLDLGPSSSTSIVAGDADGEERRRRTGEALPSFDLVSLCGTISAAMDIGGEERQQRKRKREGKEKVVCFLRPSSSCSSSSAAKDVGGEERQQTKEEEKGRAASFLDLGSSSSSSSRSAAKDADGERKRCCTLVYQRACRKRKALAPQSISTTFSAAKSSRPYKKNETSRSVRMGWVDKVVRMGGTRPRLVVTKEMTNTDVNPYYGRLPLPSARPGDPSRGGVELLLDELSAAEIRAVQSDAGLPIVVLDRWGREYDGGTLKLWAKKWYVVTGGHVWKRVLACNTLRRGDVVEVFSFRVRVLSPLPSTGISKEEGGPGQAAEEEGRRRLVLVVSVREEEEQLPWWAADAPRRPRSRRNPRRSQAIA